MTHSAANDVIYLPMPDLGSDIKAFDLNNILVYKGTPIELVAFQKDYVDWLEGSRVSIHLLANFRWTVNNRQFRYGNADQLVLFGRIGGKCSARSDE